MNSSLVDLAPLLLGFGLASRFQEYLEAVVEQRDTFHDIGDVIARHNTLAGTNADLRQQQWDVTLETDRIRQALTSSSPSDTVQPLCVLLLHWPTISKSLVYVIGT